MKIAITGHTSGIGKALYDQFLDNHEIIGFSRSNGFDINDSTKRAEIVKRCRDCDIFINNAYAPNNQTKLFADFIQAWQNEDRLVVNISSTASIRSDLSSIIPASYINDKKQQNLLFFANYSKKRFPRILNLLLGLVDTQLASSTDAKKMSPEIAAQKIINIIEHHDFHHQQMIIDGYYQL